MELFLVAVFAFVCILIGFLLSSLFQAMRISKESGSKTQQPASGLEEVARLSRDPRTKYLVVEIGDQAYKSAIDLSSEDRQELTMTAVDLRTWLGIFPSEQLSEEESTFSAPAGDFPPVVSFEPASKQPLSMEMPPQKTNLNPVKMFSEAIQESRKPVVEENTTKSIVAQIDEILQDKLENSPFSGRGVRLVEIPDQGIAVMVGLTRYNDVEDVPEVEIREIIQEAVGEWENRFTR